MKTDIPEGRRSPPAGAPEGGSPLSVVREAKPGGADPGGVKWSCAKCTSASMCLLNGACWVSCGGDSRE